jgi:hypothetical protein
LKTAKDSLIQGCRSVSLRSAISNAITSLVVQGLPDDYYPAVREERFSSDEGRRAARREAVHRSESPRDRDRRRSIAVEAALKATNIAPITYIDIEGNPAAAR